jgi:hypothetical protein
MTRINTDSRGSERKIELCQIRANPRSSAEIRVPFSPLKTPPADPPPGVGEGGPAGRVGRRFPRRRPVRRSLVRPVRANLSGATNPQLSGRSHDRRRGALRMVRPPWRLPNEQDGRSAEPTPAGPDATPHGRGPSHEAPHPSPPVRPHRSGPGARAGEASGSMTAPPAGDESWQRVSGGEPGEVGQGMPVCPVAALTPTAPPGARPLRPRQLTHRGLTGPAGGLQFPHPHLPRAPPWACSTTCLATSPAGS